MTEIYLVRHGESKGNKHYQATGQPFVGAGELGTDLSEVGKEQIQETANKLKDVTFDAIYSSDLVRAEESALIIAKQFNLSINKTIELRERIKETEPLEVAAKRLTDFLHNSSKLHKNKTIIIVTHGALMRMFLITIGFANSEDELPSGSIENGGFAKLSIEGDKFTVIETYKVNKL